MDLAGEHRNSLVTALSPLWQVRTRSLLRPIVALVLAASPALAQPAPSFETARSRHIAERAQLGLLEYCQSQGLPARTLSRVSARSSRPYRPPQAWATRRRQPGAEA